MFPSQSESLSVFDYNYFDRMDYVHFDTCP